MKAIVRVMPKASVLDPQGEAVRKAMHTLDLSAVNSVRIGKLIEVDIEATSEADAREKLQPVARDLLSNPVIEDYEIELIAESG